jgi:hypothetical protein
LELNHISRTQHRGDLLDFQEGAARPLGLRRRRLQRRHLARERSAQLRITQHAFRRVKRLANRSVGHSPTPGAIALTTASCNGSHQRQSLGKGSLDRRALLAELGYELGYELVGEREVDPVDGHGAEPVHDDRQAPLEVTDHL